MKIDTKNLLLKTDAARALFRDAQNLPIVDYHNHLDPSAIADDRVFGSLSELWVVSDPYKHRAMRINGVPENEISGDASSPEKFAAWARTCPKTWGNPLFHWSALELERVFGIDEVLDENNAAKIAKHCDAVLKRGELTANSILRNWGVEILCTSDELLGDLEIHKAATKKAKTFSVKPSLRADSIFAFGSPSFKPWLEKLSGNQKISGLDEYLAAIVTRLDNFAEAGCRLADHSLDSGFSFDLPEFSEADTIFRACTHSETVSADKIVKLKSYVLRELAAEYGKRRWTLQLHIGAQRYTSSRLRRLAGPAGGYAAIGSTCDIASLAKFLDSVECAGTLPKTILYTLNPADNQALATMTGSFSEDGVAGKIQFGPAWWYNDHKEGILAQLKALASFGLISRFVGMTTDSRSILSFSRHEYFRRLLCDFVGSLAESGEIPSDFDFLKDAVRAISYGNAKKTIFC